MKMISIWWEFRVPVYKFLWCFPGCLMFVQHLNHPWPSLAILGFHRFSGDYLHIMDLQVPGWADSHDPKLDKMVIKWRQWDDYPPATKHGKMENHPFIDDVSHSNLPDIQLVWRCSKHLFDYRRVSINNRWYCRWKKSYKPPWIVERCWIPLSAVSWENHRRIIRESYGIWSILLIISGWWFGSFFYFPIYWE